MAWTEDTAKRLNDTAETIERWGADLAADIRAALEEIERPTVPTCDRCSGRGSRVYPDTTTWRGGVGGQTLTDGICDRCWGTGRLDVKGPDQRAIGAKISNLIRERAAALDEIRRLLALLD